MMKKKNNLQKNKMVIYYLKDTKKLLFNIKRQCNNSFLVTKLKEQDLPYKPGNLTTIREYFRIFYNKLDFESIDERDRIKVENAFNDKSPYKQVSIMTELLTKYFTNEEIVTIFPQNFKTNLYDFALIMPLSIDTTPSEDSEEKEMAIINKEIQSIFDQSEKITTDEKVYREKIHTDIKSSNVEESINSFFIYFNELLEIKQKSGFNPTKYLNKIKRNKSIQNIRKRLFKYYKDLHGQIEKSQRKEIKNYFNEKTREYLHISKGVK